MNSITRPAVRVERERPAWIVIAGSHGWLFGSLSAALAGAREIARGFGTLVVMDGRP